MTHQGTKFFTTYMTIQRRIYLLSCFIPVASLAPCLAHYCKNFPFIPCVMIDVFCVMGLVLFIGALFLGNSLRLEGDLLEFRRTILFQTNVIQYHKHELSNFSIRIEPADEAEDTRSILFFDANGKILFVYEDSTVEMEQYLKNWIVA